MSDFVDLTGGGKNTPAMSNFHSITAPESNVPDYNNLQRQLAEANLLVDDIILKKYVTKLTELDIVPFDESLKNIGDIRLFKITEMVYQKDEYSTYKFASVFNSVQNLNCGVFIIADSNGQKTDFYMGVRSLDNKRTTKSLKDTLKNALYGQFPGVKTHDMFDSEAEEFLDNVQSKNIASVSCVAKNKDEEFKDNESFIQGLEKLALAMQGQRYTAIVLAKSTPVGQLDEMRRAYEAIYTQLSPFANMQLSYGTNMALNVSEAFSSGVTKGTSHSTNESIQTGSNHTAGTGTNESVTKPGAETYVKGLGAAILGVASVVTAPLTGGASLLAAGLINAGQIGLSVIQPSSKGSGTSTNESHTTTESKTIGTTDTENESSSQTSSETKGITTGKSDTMQLTMQNKSIMNTLERIDLQLKRIDECESLGMWECAAYFLSDSQETVEMAAGTYKALIKGEKSGVESSAINFWGRKNAEKLPMLREYITHFIHPVFEYRSASRIVPVTASSLISGNELAIQMGLPRKSVCGLPVIEHADFGKDVTKYGNSNNKSDFILGNVFSMGSDTKTEVRLDRDSLTMHTFITGSTGSGKSNTVYEILNQLRNVYNVPFLVVEPAKGEYKNIFGQFPDVSVFGTNPKKTNLLRLNPFRFPSDIHILEHLDRIVELFNVCWPMYAAMPAILKEAMERAYIAAGWDINTSENSKGEVYPNFTDLLEQLETVIKESKYSADSKGDYSGALCTRVRSLTNGLNGLVFCKNDLAEADIFDKKVIVDLSRIGSVETKSLIMGLLIIKLNEYRMTSGKINSPLSHITVLEEAHNLLKRTSTEQSSESTNLLGKSVELLANSIAEMRTYGEGFIIADQSPGLLDMSVIRNTNTKIILRLPEYSDRELVGLSAGLNKEQIEELAKLECGVAAIYQNDWVEPVLVKVNKCAIAEKNYSGSDKKAIADISHIRKQVVNMLIQGRVSEQLDFDVTEIRHNIDNLNLSSRIQELLEEQIAEFEDNNELILWNDKNLPKLSKLIVDVLDVRSHVENYAVTSLDHTELTQNLSAIIRQSGINASEVVILPLMQCFMKDFSIGINERETREDFYKAWIDSVKEGRINQ